MATKKQKEAFFKITENTENKGKIGEIMKEVGYAENTSLKPTNLTESKGWKELLAEHLPDSLLAEKHKELLTVPKIIRHYKKGDLETEVEELDTNAISKGLDMGYKLKGHYAAEKHQNLNIDIELDSKSMEISKKYEDEIKQSL